MQKTPFAGLTELDISESLLEDGGAFAGRDRETIDRFLQIGAKTHRHDGAAGLADPTSAPSAAVVASGGTISADIALTIGYTAQDGQRGETLLSPVAVVTTGPPLASPQATPSATVIYNQGGELTDGSYYYGLTYVDSEGGETPLGPVVYAARQPGYATAKVLLSHLDVGMAEQGASAWRLYRQKGGGNFAYLGSGTASAYVDDGTGEAICDVQPPNDNFDNTTNSINTVTITLPGLGSLPAGTEFINVYVSQSGGFEGQNFLEQYPVASAGTTQVFRALDLQDDTPPDVNTSVGGASKIDPDTEIEDWHWKRPVATWEDLPPGDLGDVRLVEDEGRLYAVLASAGVLVHEDWSEVSGGGGGGGGITQVEGDTGPNMAGVTFLKVLGSGAASTEGEVGGEGEAIIRVTVVPEPGPPGADGSDGAPGASGAPGPPGASGANGKDGKDGASGAVGPQGPPGSGALMASATSGAAVTPVEKLTIVGSGAATTRIEKGGAGEAIVTVTVPQVAGPPGASGAVGASGASGASGAPGVPGASASITVRASGVSVKNTGVLDFGSGATVKAGPSNEALVTIANPLVIADSSGNSASGVSRLGITTKPTASAHVYQRGASAEVELSTTDYDVWLDAISFSPVGSASVSWTHTPESLKPKGIVVLIVQNGTAEDQITEVKYGGVKMKEVIGSPLLHSTGAEDAAIHAFYLGTQVKAGKQTVTVTATGANQKAAVCYSVGSPFNVLSCQNLYYDEGEGEYNAIECNTKNVKVRTGSDCVIFGALQTSVDDLNGSVSILEKPVIEDLLFDFGSQTARFAHADIMAVRRGVENVRWNNAGHPKIAVGIVNVVMRPVRDLGVEEGFSESGAVGDRQSVLVDSTRGIYWDFVYDGLGEFPWKKVGGAPLTHFVEANAAFASENYGVIAGGPELAMPFKGDYKVMHGCQSQLTGGPSSNSAIALFLGEAVQTPTTATLVGLDQFEGGSMTSAPIILSGAAAGAVLRQRYKGFVATQTWNYQLRWIEIDAVRVSG